MITSKDITHKYGLDLSASSRLVMLHVDLVLQHSESLYCTCAFSCNIQSLYIARAPSLATFRGFMLHVDLVLQHSEALYCTWTFSCNIRELYVARGPSLATFVILFTQTKKLRQIKIVSACFITLALAD